MFVKKFNFCLCNELKGESFKEIVDFHINNLDKIVKNERFIEEHQKFLSYLHKCIYPTFALFSDYLFAKKDVHIEDHGNSKELYFNYLKSKYMEDLDVTFSRIDMDLDFLNNNIKQTSFLEDFYELYFSHNYLKKTNEHYLEELKNIILSVLDTCESKNELLPASVLVSLTLSLLVVKIIAPKQEGIK